MKGFVLFILTVGLVFSGIMFLQADGNMEKVLVEYSALTVIVYFAAVTAVVSFLFGLVSNDYSWVDRIWSVLPFIFAWIYYVKNPSPHLLGLAVLITVWGLRLSFNFGRKGGYSGTEDYRWPILKQKIKSPLVWQLFHLLFINGFQISLFVLFTLPLKFISENISSSYLPSQTLLLVLYSLAAATLIFETIADQQQWNFHKRKKLGVASGFLENGLFSWSRHPNYFGELSFWWVIYLFAIAYGSPVLSSALIGVLLLTALFIGSTGFTESITAKKYSGYADYQMRTSAIVPFPPKKNHAEIKNKTV